MTQASKFYSARQRSSYKQILKLLLLLRLMFCLEIRVAVSTVALESRTKRLESAFGSSYTKLLS